MTIASVYVPENQLIKQMKRTWLTM